MDVLVCVATRHQATAEIAERIGATIRTGLAEGMHGARVDVRRVEDAPLPSGYAAVVIGSAVYMGKWLPAAKRYITDNAEALAARPVWLFSSGPIGDPLKPTEDPADVPSMVSATGARQHHMFAGKLDRSQLSWSERTTVRVVHAPDGDFRDWSDVDAYASGVARDILATLVPGQ